jgi:oligoribonuclease
MTGLDPDEDEIIEIFCLITDAKLNLLDADGWGAIVHQSKETMDKMVAHSSHFARKSEAKHRNRANGVQINTVRLVLQHKYSNRRRLPSRPPTTS